MKLEGIATVAEGIKELRGAGLIVERIHTYASSWKDKSLIIIDKGNPNLPDFQNGASLSICRGDYEMGKGIYIVGHQHCQHQLYKTIDTLASIFDGEFYGYDGGYGFNDCFKDWVDKGKPEIQTENDEIRRKIIKIFSDKQNHKELKDIFKRHKRWDKRKDALSEFLKKFIYVERLRYIKDEKEKSDVWDSKEQYMRMLSWKVAKLLDATYVCMENKNVRNIILGENRN